MMEYLLNEFPRSPVESIKPTFEELSLRSTLEMMDFLKEQLETQSLQIVRMAKSLRSVQREIVTRKEGNRLIRPERTRITEQEKDPTNTKQSPNEIEVKNPKEKEPKKLVLTKKDFEEMRRHDENISRGN